MIDKIYSFLVCLTISCTAIPSDELPLHQLKLPPGYSIELFADQLSGVRTMTRSDSGVIFVGTRAVGKIYAVYPPTTPNQKATVKTLLSDLNEPHGVAYHNGDLYVAELHQITKYPNIDKHLDAPPQPVLLNDTLPPEKWHGYRVLKIGPDNQMYVSIGMPCNTCNHRKEQPLFGSISTASLDGKSLTPHAIGIRNSVGFAWHPLTQELWFTDNGQDMMGPDIPPDEVNRIERAGQDFGFPYVYGDNILAPGYNQKDIQGLTFQVPKVKLQAHVAPLGMMFRTADSMLVAEHGSWNRLKKVGYQITEVKLKGNDVVEVEPFITGWLQGQDPWGRPVDLLTLPDGSFLVTDDLNGVIYRLVYKAPM